jgi:hypothetical protein
MPELAEFMVLYENLNSHRVDGVTLSEPFEPTDEQEESLRDLVFWRNYFMHSLPALQLLSAWEKLRIMPGCISFAELLTQTPRLRVLLDVHEEAKKSIAILKRQTESLRRKYLGKYPQLAADE